MHVSEVVWAWVESCTNNSWAMLYAWPLMLHVHVHIQVREDVSTNSLQVLGFVMIRYSDHEVQRKVQSMKHTIKNHEVDIKFQRVCGLMYIIVYIFIGFLFFRPHSPCQNCCFSKDKNTCSPLL